MAEIILRPQDLLGPVPAQASDDEPLLVHFPDDPIELQSELRKLWGAVLLLAVRDHATSIHYHPWRSDGKLSYVLEGLHRYELIPPPLEHAHTIVDVARALFTPPRGLLSRLGLRSPAPTVCATVTLDVWGNGNLIVWDVVCWSSGERLGVELYRVTPLDRPVADRTSDPHPCA